MQVQDCIWKSHVERRNMTEKHSFVLRQNDVKAQKDRKLCILREGMREIDAILRTSPMVFHRHSEPIYRPKSFK